MSFEQPEPIEQAAVETKSQLTRTVLENPEEVNNFSKGELAECREEIEDLPEYVAYKNERVNFDTLDSYIEDFNKQTGEKGDSVVRENLGELVGDVKQKTEDYYNSVLAVERAQIHRFRLDEREAAEMISRRDEARSRTHEALISDIRSLTRYCNTKLPEVRVKIPEDKLFTKGELGNRDFIGRWAFVNERGRRLADIIRLIDEKLSKDPKRKKQAA